MLATHTIRQQSDEKTIEYFQTAMNRYDPDTEEYRRCQHIVSYFMEIVRAKERSERELFAKHQRLLVNR